MKSVLTGLALVMIAAGSIAQTPESYLEMGYRYRWVEQDLTAATPDTTYFPLRGGGSDTRSTTPTGQHGRWLFITQLGTGGADHKIEILSTAFPAGKDTVETNDSNRTYVIGGIDIEGYSLIGDATPVTGIAFMFTVTD